MNTSPALSPSDSSKTPPSPTQETGANSPALPQDALFTVTHSPDLASGVILCNRYRVQHSLGKGGFGGVYLALDLELDRKVAIKRQIGKHLADTELARNEAKFIAGLDHPSIVKVFDLIDDQQEGVLIVMEYVNGVTLHEFLKKKPISIARAMALATDIAQALIHAHSRRIIHRDLKPSNVLLDQLEKVKLSDFGLALGAINLETAPSAAGTPRYMAPEQVRGESNRIDGRTDLWALGVMLYEMLGGAPPFAGLSRGAIFESILYDDPLPLRQLNPRIPEEIERIVDRCMRKRMSERPASASDLADDLQSCLAAAKSLEVDLTPSAAIGPIGTNGAESRTPKAASSSHLRPLQVEPKGLRPYSEDDGVHFLDLIPGPRERSGLPESIHFWKKWASCDNVDEYASVGVLYGPSGAGKTSFVRAGLLNQLDNDICPIFVECRAGDLMGRIETAIGARFHQKSVPGSLSKLLSVLRDEEGGVYGYRKILIILDQFESWSTAASAQERRLLAEALRHCDGKVLQCLFVVRDDYWSGITEIMQWIDLPLIENRNVRSLELLDARHAQRVLEGMGRSHGMLPPAPAPLTTEQQLFIRQAVDGLAENGRIVAVHLVMFAQIVRVIPWTPQMLRKQGGVQGACAAYLNQIFESSAAPPAYRRLAGVVADILSQLLPAHGEALKASAKSLEDIRSQIPAANRGAKFTEALRILSEDLKLITATRDETEAAEVAPAVVGYQLSHDFLVEPVRNWGELFRKSSWRGRAVARLIELSDLWQRRPQAQFLPSLGEYAAMSYVVPSSSRNERQTKYLRAAGRYHLGKAAGMTIATVVAVFFAVLAINEWSKRTEAERLALIADADSLVYGRIEAAPRMLDKLSKKPQCWPIVNALLNDPSEKVKIRVGLLGQRVGKSTFTSVADLLEFAEPELFEPILAAATTQEARAALRAICKEETLPVARRARAAILLMQSGEEGPLLQMLRSVGQADSEQAMVLESSITWKGKFKAWAQLLEGADDNDSIQGILLVLGLFRTDEIDSGFSFGSVKRYCNSKHCQLQSSAKWLLHRHNQAIPNDQLEPPEDADWKRMPVSKVELRKIEPGELRNIAFPKTQKEPDIFRVEKPLWVSVYPVTRARFLEFYGEGQKLPTGEMLSPLLDNQQLDDQLERNPARPAVGLSYDHGVLFCNWLSRRESLSESYEFSGSEEIAGQKKPRLNWKLKSDSTGFRMLSDQEIRYAMLAGMSQGLPWAHAQRLNDAMGNQSMDGVQLNSRLVWTTIPNRWGLFWLDPANRFWCESPERTKASLDLYVNPRGEGYFGLLPRTKTGTSSLYDAILFGCEW